MQHGSNDLEVLVIIYDRDVTASHPQRKPCQYGSANRLPLINRRTISGASSYQVILSIGVRSIRIITYGLRKLLPIQLDRFGTIRVMRALQQPFAHKGVTSKMIIGDRLRELRVERNFSQAEIENRTGLLRCYISRVEHGHTVPTIETLDKIAGALEVPLYRLFYAGNDPRTPLHFSKAKNRTGSVAWGSRGKDARLLEKLRRFLGLLHDRDKRLLLSVVGEMVNRKNRAAAPKKVG